MTSQVGDRFGKKKALIIPKAMNVTRKVSKPKITPPSFVTGGSTSFSTSPKDIASNVKARGDNIVRATEMATLEENSSITKDDRAQQLWDKGYEIEGMSKPESFGQAMKGHGQDFLDTAKESVKRTQEGEQSLAQEIFLGVGSTANVIGDAFGELWTRGLKKTLEITGLDDDATRLKKELLEKPSIQEGITALSKSIDDYNVRAESHPEEARNLGASFDIGMLALDIAGVSALTKTAKQGAKTVVKGAEGVSKGIGEVATKGAQSVDSLLFNVGTPEKMLTKAIKPRIASLSKSTSAKGALENVGDASKLVLKHSDIVPINTATQADAWSKAMKNIWSKIDDKLDDGAKIKINGEDIAKSVDDYITKNPALSTVSPDDLKTLKKLSESLRKAGSKDVMFWENAKQIYNASTNRGKSDVSDSLKNAYKEISKSIGVHLDDSLSKVPGEFSSLKKDYGKLRSLYDDVWKADVIAQRKAGKGLYESFSRMDGVGDILGAIGGLTTGKNPLSGIAKGVGKIAMGQKLQKMSDPDALIKAAYEQMRKAISK